FTWVVDAPMFGPAAEATASGDVALGNSSWTVVHHAFTSAKPECMDSFDENPGEATSYAYDIVCNGNEIGGGSVRIHNADVQKRVFNVMFIGDEEAQEQLASYLDAFQYCAPPHGGFASAWDRTLCLLGVLGYIPHVIAFPKSGRRVDPLPDAPAPIPAQKRKATGVDFQPEKS